MSLLQSVVVRYVQMPMPVSAVIGSVSRFASSLGVRACALTILIATSAGSVCAGGLFDEIKASWQPSDTQILDRHGEALHRLRTDTSVRRGQWVALADVSPALRTALVLSEDKRFYEHSGVDWQAVPAAAWANLWNRKTRGASTLTMQLAGLLDEDLKRNAGGRSVLQKLKQTVSAEWLEQRLRKDQILEAYLNLVPFRGELVGIDALSQTLFGKAPHGLDEREAAVAAALVRAPNAKPAQVAQRACAVIKEMQRSNVDSSTSSIAKAAPVAGQTRSAKPTSAAPAATADCGALDFFTTASLQRRDYPASEGIAPHVAQQVTAAYRARPPDLQGVVSATVRPELVEGPVRHQGASTRTARKGVPPPAAIRTTLDAPLQRFAVQTLQQQLRELRGRHVEDGALVVLDNASGQVLAWVGSSGELSQASEVDGVTALRQPGSTLKPFLYAQAIGARRLTAASLLEDSSTQIQTSGGLYIPQNYDHQFKGWVSVRTALGASLNVPAVRTLVLVSPDAFHRQLVQLGLPLKESGDYYGYSLALGSAEVSLLALANAYRALANGGRTSATTLTTQPTGKSSPATQPHRNAASGAPKPDQSIALRSDLSPPPLGQARDGGLISSRAYRQASQALDARAAFIVSDTGPRPHLWHRQRAGHALLERRQNRHQQGHARQLGAGLFASLHGGRVGGQRQRRADVGCQRHHRCRPDLGRADELPARQTAKPATPAAGWGVACQCALWHRPGRGKRQHRRGRSPGMVFARYAASAIYA